MSDQYPPKPSQRTSQYLPMESFICSRRKHVDVLGMAGKLFAAGLQEAAEARHG